MKFIPQTLPVLPSTLTLGIGIIGCGGIVQWGHMPAYRQAGFNVVGIASRNPQRVQAFAEKWQIPRAYDDWRKLIALNEVRIVDVTYPFDEERLEIVRAAAAAGKHILMQKPMAHSPEAAAEMVRITREAGVLLAVNQNARYCPQYQAAWQAIQQGLIGQVHFAHHEMYNTQDSQDWWHAKCHGACSRFQLIEYSVHHLDLLRWWFGSEPAAVQALIGRKPTQRTKAEMITAVQMQMPAGGLAIMTDHNVSYPKTPPRSRFRIEGSRGMIEGQVMHEDSLTLYSDLLEESPVTPQLEGNWFPGAFVSTMGELMRAIEEHREPTLSGRDNLKTLDIIFQAYRSAEARNA